jgi:hypothetical protein
MSVEDRRTLKDVIYRYETAIEDQQAWGAEDWEIALRHACRHVRRAYGLAQRNIPVPGERKGGNRP